jgi:hypothetical protein
MLKKIDKTTILHNVLTRSNAELGGILTEAHRLQELESIFYSILEDRFHSHCRIAQFHSTQLTLLIDNANWATPIRYLAPDLITQLKNHREFEQLETIECHIAPDIFQMDEENYPKQRNPSHMPMSETNKKNIRIIAEQIQDPKLKAALLKLIEHKE